MKRFGEPSAIGLLLGLPLALALSPACAGPLRPSPAEPPVPGTVAGFVYEDRDADGVRDAHEPGIAGVAVSNGREVVRSARDGSWRLPLPEPGFVFVVKPTGFMTPVDERGLPRFALRHAPAGSPAELAFPGHEPTGPLPDSIDFGLLPYPEDRTGAPFRVLLFGDTQPFDVGDVDHLARDIVQTLPERDVTFGMTLGDVVHDDLALYEPITLVTAVLGVPWVHVIGNHDLNFDAPDDATSDDTFERVFGPATHAFEYGGVHFIVLDDVIFLPGPSGGSYRGGLREDQLVFVEQYLAEVPKEALVVLAMHIPLVGPPPHQVPERDRLFAILADHPHQLSLSGHTHFLQHHFLGAADGNPGPLHHHANLGATSGSWWRGAPDESGVPHTTMRCGAPNGYAIARFEGTDYRLEWRAARRPAEQQMSLYAPSELRGGRLAEPAEAPVLWANVWNGSERTRVEMRAVRAGDLPAPEAGWIPLERRAAPDPGYVAAQLREASMGSGFRPLPDPIPSPHLWRGPIPPLPPGAWTLEVRARDWDGQIHHGRHILRILPRAPGDPRATPTRR